MYYDQLWRRNGGRAVAATGTNGLITLTYRM